MRNVFQKNRIVYVAIVATLLTGLATTSFTYAEPVAEPTDYVIVSDEASGQEPVASSPNAASEEVAPRTLPADAVGAEVSGEVTSAPRSRRILKPVNIDAVDDAESVEHDIPEATSESSAKEVPAETPEVSQEQGATTADAGSVAVEGASFKGVLPGMTSIEEMEAAWGPAKEIRKSASGTQYIHYLKPFKQVVATVAGGRVDTIVIQLETLFEPQALTNQLKLDDIPSAAIYDNKGQKLGLAFPERGVLFGLSGSTPERVAQIVVEPVNSQPFVTRAELNCCTAPTEALVDVEYAIEIDPEYDRSYCVRAMILMQLGQFDRALKSVEKALALVPHEPEHRLVRARLFLHMQDYEQALSESQRLVKDDQASELIKAQAYQLWGDALAQGPTRAFDEALTQHTEAIKLAEALSLNTVGPVRVAAKDLLVDAHLAIANDIAWGNWQKKADVVPKWIDRANAFCTSMIDQNQADESIRFRVHTKALQAYAGMKESPEIDATIDAMNKLGAELLEAETIEARKQMIAWSLAEAMANAMAVAQAQGNADAATQFGQQALLHFEKSGKVGEAWPGRAITVGKLYYRLGAIQAISHTDHNKALAWYEKAVPLLESPTPVSASADPGRLGEMFVSIAVSHWEAGNRDEAVRLTQQGASLMETAVTKNLLPQSALGVPYGNLSSMHAEMGNAGQSEQFASKAAKLETARR